ncbi:hypothetical protein D3C81_2103930 [compost metagenome]
MDGAVEAQVALVGKPEQGAQAAFVALAGQAELIRFGRADQVFHVEGHAPREGLIQL